MTAVAIDVAVDSHAAAAVGYRVVAFGVGHEAGCEQPPRCDVAIHAQVADFGILDVAERGSVLLITVVVEGQRVTAAVEDSTEGLRVIACGTRSHHCRDADVGIELEVRVAVAKIDP